MLSYSVNEACVILLHIQLLTIFASNMFFCEAGDNRILVSMDFYFENEGQEVKNKGTYVGETMGSGFSCSL